MIMSINIYEERIAALEAELAAVKQGYLELSQKKMVLKQHLENQVVDLEAELAAANEKITHMRKIYDEQNADNVHVSAALDVACREYNELRPHRCPVDKDCETYDTATCEFCWREYFLDEAARQVKK